MAEPLQVAGGDITEEHLGRHIAVTTLPEYRQIDGEIVAVQPFEFGGTWLRVHSRPFGFEVPVSLLVGPDKLVELHEDPVEAVRARG